MRRFDYIIVFSLACNVPCEYTRRQLVGKLLKKNSSLIFDLFGCSICAKCFWRMRLRCESFSYFRYFTINRITYSIWYESIIISVILNCCFNPFLIQSS